MWHSKMALKYVFLHKHFGVTAAQIVDISRFYFQNFILYPTSFIETFSPTTKFRKN